jgi:hypothetical protein
MRVWMVGSSVCGACTQSRDKKARRDVRGQVEKQRLDRHIRDWRVTVHSTVGLITL